MTRLEIITTVLSRLGRQEGNTYLLGRAAEELELIQQRLEGGAFLPWFLLSDEDTSLTTVADTRTVSVPATFLREWEDYPLYRYDSTADDPYIPLAKDEFDLMEANLGGEESGEPTHYALIGEQIELFPTPNAAYPLRWRYYEAEAVLAADADENAWTDNAADLLVAELGIVMAGYKRDEYWINKFQQDQAIAMNRLIAFDEARKQANRPGYRGDV